MLNALGSLAAIPQFFVWRLEWLPDKAKFKKTPCYPDGSVYIMDAKDPANWLPLATALQVLVPLQQRNDGYRYALGFYLTASTGFWFLDVDNCVGADGQLTPIAQQCCDLLPGVFREWSSSNRGLHFIGRGQLPQHANKHKVLGLELYTDLRGIAFGLSGQADGSADTIAPYAPWIASTYFPIDPAEVAAADEPERTGPRDDWRGPTDDGELIRRALMSRSAASRLGGRASFADLWQRNVPVLRESYPPDPGADDQFGESEADAALASHLAFWTGCDPERIERIMRQSALARPKWDEHRTYLRKLTIGRACLRCETVCNDEPPPAAKAAPVAAASMPLLMAPAAAATVATGEVVGPQLMATVDDYAAAICSADEMALRAEIIPAIAADPDIEELDRLKLGQLVRDALAGHGVPTTVALVRKLLAYVPIETEGTEEGVPAFAMAHVYVTNGDLFFNANDGNWLSRTGFNAIYNRMMPIRGNGDREEAAKWCLERWGMRAVTDLMYHPTMPSIFEFEGRWFGNLYNASTIPTVANGYSEAGIAAINLYQRMLFEQCGRRADVASQLLGWIAHNVKYPGRKIRWAPIIKGVEGDGKSIHVSVMRAAMGLRNVRGVGPSVVTNNGGFNDWAAGSAVVAFEEIMITGRDRYRIYNSVKELITNDVVSINRKGATAIDVLNVTNYLAFSNHSDAIPLGDTDRRWFVIFTPWSTVGEMARLMEVSDVATVFNQLFASLRDHRGEWRRWLLELPIVAGFEPNGRAPATNERATMRDNGEDDIEAMARGIIEDGREFIRPLALSSAKLSAALKTQCLLEGGMVPKTTGMNHLLMRLGFSSHGRLKIDGVMHRVWTREKFNDDALRAYLKGI